MVTVNTNLYCLVGNRGRIYITNGSQAQLYKKIPDHISDTVEPYFIWGGLTYQKNQLYIGVYTTTNAGTLIPNYGGLWAIDIDTNALRLTNQLSFGDYSGFASAIQSVPGNVSGSGLYIGWVSDTTNDATGGIDATNSTPYTGSQVLVESDLIPIGTFNKPRDSQQIEFRLTKPLVSGESINLYSRTNFSASYGTLTFLTTPTIGDFSGTASTNFKNAQWIQIKAVLRSTASSPSYVRLREIRITGLV